MSKRLLIVDDEQASRRTLQLHFTQRGFIVDTAGNSAEALTATDGQRHDLVISDIRMPGDSGLILLEKLRETHPRLPVILITAYHDLETTVQAMQAGAVDYVPKPIDIDELDGAVDRALDGHDDPDAALVLGRENSPSLMVGRSHVMKEIFKAIGLVSQSRFTVLITGESGVGKELVARAIHQASEFADAPFVAVNSAALVETLLESEMFGHEKGAFTGAVSARKGKVELAGSGSLFLDEIGELSPRMQGKLLRLLEAREYTPLGGQATRLSKARFIAATNVDLAEAVAEGRFRTDLYYRLNVLTIHIPPLHERREDIPPLVEHLLQEINRDLRKGIRQVSSEVMDRLVQFDWPGNVRQLQNVLMQAVVMATGDQLNLSHLPPEIAGRGGNGTAGRCDGETGDNPIRSLKDLEREHIKRVLEETRWHKGRTCEILGVSRPRLERRIREFDLAPSSK